MSKIIVYVFVILGLFCCTAQENQAEPIGVMHGGGRTTYWTPQGEFPTYEEAKERKLNERLEADRKEQKRLRAQQQAQEQNEAAQRARLQALQKQNSYLETENFVQELELERERHQNYMMRHGFGY